MRTRFWIVRVPDDIWAPFWEGLLICVVAVTAWLAGHPWLFSSLGPTAYEQAEKPHSKSARLYNVVVGHLVGLGCGFLGIALLNAWAAPKVSGTTFVPLARLGAAVIAAVATTFINLELESSQPAALATSLLVALGPYDTAKGALWVVVGVLILAAIGEPVRRLRLPKPERE
jgi:hypothetical protein